MFSSLRKYFTAVAPTKDYTTQWSPNRVVTDQELIVPFPTLAKFDSDKHIWSVYINAWIYSPFQTKSLTSYLPSLPNFLTSNKNDETNGKETQTNEVNTEASIKLSDKKDHKIKITEEFEPSIDAIIIENEYDETDTTNKEDNEVVKQDERNNSNDDLDEEILREKSNEFNETPGRLGLFFVGNAVKIATKSIINDIEHLLKPSDESGFIEQHLEFSDKEIESLCTTTHPNCEDRKFDYEIQVIKTKENSNDEIHKTFKCTIYVLASHGISVISDIDDTIKISNVPNKTLLLKHTFYSYFKPIEGMSEVFQKWNKQKCQFHYVSAGPWQLYPALRCFFEKYKFPKGTINLRKFTWSLQFFNITDTYKIDAITNIIDAYPLRKYICVGDSGENDPEIYSKLYTKYSQSIIHIFIHDVCQSPKCLPKCDERYKKAFGNVPKQHWTIFKHPKEIETDINKLLSI